MSSQILIIEDQLALAQALASLVSRLGLSAQVSGDGLDGLKKYSAQPYDLLVVDLHLPKLSGVEVIRKIRNTNRGKSLPVIIITGIYKGAQYAERARSALNIQYYLEKPFTQEAFLSAVKDCLGLEKPTPMPKEDKKEMAAPAKMAPADKNEVLAGQTGSGSPPGPATSSPPAVKITPLPSVPPSAASSPPKPSPPAAPSNAKASPSAAGPAAKTVAEIKPRPALRGNLRDKPLDLILLEARRQRASGLLFLKKGSEECQITFLSGIPISLSFPNPDFSFGNFLFSQGKVSLMEFQVYQSQRKNNPAAEELFVKMGCLTPEEYFSQWRKFVTEGLLSLFAWSEGEFIFQLFSSLPDASSFLPVNFAALIYEGYQRHLSPNRLAHLRHQAAGRFLALAPPAFDYQMHLPLSPEEIAFLEKIDGSRRLEELLPAGGEGEKLLRTLAVFLSLGMVEVRQKPAEIKLTPPFPVRPRLPSAPPPSPPPAETLTPPPPEVISPLETEAQESAGEGFEDITGELEESLGEVVEEIQKEVPAPPPPPARESEQEKREKELLDFYAAIKDKNHYEILGLKLQNFDFTKMKENYFRLTKQFSPEHFIMSSGEILSKAEEVLSRVATAYNTLSNVVSKEKYDEMLAMETRAAGRPGDKDQEKMHAEVAFQSGLAFLEMEDYEAAEKSLAEAAALSPNNAEVLAHYAYAVYNKNRRAKTVQKRVQELLSKSLRLDPKCAAAFAYRGLLLLEDERPALAEADFKKALALNPRQLVALKGLRALEQKKQADKKGLFGRLLK